MATLEKQRSSQAIGQSENDSGSSELPDVDQLPDSDVVIYDRQCNFCRAQVKKLKRFSGGRLSYLSLHDERVAERYPDLTHQQLMEQMYVVSVAGARYGGAAAIRYLSRRLPRMWFAAPLLHIPFSLPVWQYLYDAVAKRRYRIAGRSGGCEEGSCRIHKGNQETP